MNKEGKGSKVERGFSTLALLANQTNESLPKLAKLLQTPRIYNPDDGVEYRGYTLAVTKRTYHQSCVRLHTNQGNL